MTIAAWILLSVVWLICILVSIFVVWCAEEKLIKILTVIIAIIIAVGSYAGARFYFSTAGGIRALTDERSNLSNGIERTINVYTADGSIIATYEGKIDLEMDQDYVKFDWQGKRYIYYNCFVETIAEIP